MAERILAGVERAELPLRLDRETEGDGNCFPRAVVQQPQREEVAREWAVAGQPPIRHHHQLRQKVADFIHKSRLQLIMEFKDRYGETHPEEPWAAYWQKMRQDRVWVDSIMVQATAWFLRHDLIIVWNTATPEDPYIISPG